MTRTAFAALACAALLAAQATPALSQGAVAPSTPGAAKQAPAPSAKPRPGGKPAAAGGQSVPGTANLTAGECKRLGGKIYTAPNCKVTGTRCVIHLQGGDIRAPCIDEVDKN
jgi:hypothetical protein